MGLRQRMWAIEQTKRLRNLLGDKCSKCGSLENLQFDVVIPIGDNQKGDTFHHRDMEWSWRLSFYRREYDKGNLQLLCNTCNSQKGDGLVLNPNLKDSMPF